MQCFPARVPQNFFTAAARNREINKKKHKFCNTAKNAKYTSKYGGNFCPALGNTGVILE
jgi:hypothetical protein